MNCHKCGGIIVYPEGIDGEKTCSSCGLVLDDLSTQHSFSSWSPEWHSNWSEQDSVTVKDWLTTLRAVSCQLNIPNYPYREEAARKIRKHSRLLGKSQRLSKNKRATVAALIHVILKEYNKERSLKQISKELSISQRTIMKSMKI